MSKVGDHVKCPECGGESRIVWVSRDGETSSNKMYKISQSNKSPLTKFTLPAETKMKKGMTFLAESRS